ncbi:MAG: hypothetical protein AAF787_02625 [Chloroflexota bacterium]
MSRKSHAEPANALDWLASLKRKPPRTTGETRPGPEALRKEVLAPSPPVPRHSDMPHWLRDADTASLSPDDIPAWLLEDIPQEPASRPLLPAPEPPAAPPAAVVAAPPEPSPIAPATASIEAHNTSNGLDDDLVAIERLIRAGQRLDDVVAVLENMVRRYRGLDLATCYRLKGDAHYRRGEHALAMAAYRQGLALL